MIRRGAALAGRFPLGWILLLALVVRLAFVQSREITYDDAFSILLSARSLSEIMRGTAADTMPPLYYFLLHGWMQISPQISWLRLLSIGLNLLACGLVYGIARRLNGQRSAAWAGVFMALSPMMYYHAQDLRNYSLLLAALLGTLYCFIRLDSRARASFFNGERGARIEWVGLILCSAAALYTHNAAIFSLAALNGYLLLRGKIKRLAGLMVAQAVAFALFAPWLVWVPGQFEKIQRAWWLGRPGWLETVQAFVMATAGLPLPGAWLTVGLALAILIVIFCAWAGFRRRKEWSGKLLLIAVTLIPPGLLFAASYVVRPVFVPRAFIFSVAGFYILCGAVVAAAWRRTAGEFLAIALVAAMLVGLPAQMTFNEFPRSPFKQAADDLSQRQTPGEVIVHDNKLSAFPMLVYRPELPQRYLADEPGSGNDTLAAASQLAMGLPASVDIQQAVGNATGVQFVYFRKTVQEFQAAGLAGHPVIVWLTEHYRLAGVSIYNDLEVAHFVR